MATRPNTTSLFVGKIALVSIGVIATLFGILCLVLAYLTATVLVPELPAGHHLSYLNLAFWQPYLVTLTLSGIICLMLGGGFVALTVTFRAPRQEIIHDQLLWDIEHLLPAIIASLLVETKSQISAVVSAKKLSAELKLLQPTLSDKTADILATMAQLTISELRPLVHQVAQAYSLLQSYHSRSNEIATEVAQLQSEIEGLADAVARAIYTKTGTDQNLEGLKSRLSVLIQKIDNLDSDRKVTRLQIPAE